MEEEEDVIYCGTFTCGEITNNVSCNGDKNNNHCVDDKLLVEQFMNPAFLINFIKLYKNATCLWRVRSKNYHDKLKKDDALKQLLQFTRLMIPGASMSFMMKRIHHIRYCYTREYHKVESAKVNGLAHCPQLWYYNLLEFLNETIIACSSVKVFEEDLAFQDEEPASLNHESEVVSH